MLGLLAKTRLLLGGFQDVAFQVLLTGFIYLRDLFVTCLSVQTKGQILRPTCSSTSIVGLCMYKKKACAFIVFCMSEWIAYLISLLFPLAFTRGVIWELCSHRLARPSGRTILFILSQVCSIGRNPSRRNIDFCLSYDKLYALFFISLFFCDPSNLLRHRMFTLLWTAGDARKKNKVCRRAVFVSSAGDVCRISLEWDATLRPRIFRRRNNVRTRLLEPRFALLMNIFLMLEII